VTVLTRLRATLFDGSARHKETRCPPGRYDEAHIKRLKFGRRRRKRSVEAWIVCEQAAYRFHISNLYKEVIPDQCYFKVNQRSQRVTLILKKYETNPWRFLRS
jgi:elongation factor P hydroxylase